MGLGWDDGGWEGVGGKSKCMRKSKSTSLYSTTNVLGDSFLATFILHTGGFTKGVREMSSQLFVCREIDR